MTGEEKWDFLTKGDPERGGYLFGLAGRPLTCIEIDGIMWARREIIKLREIIKQIEESGVCE
jgi:hypothetical protein